MLCNRKKENLQKNFCIRGSICHYNNNSNTDLLLILFVFSPCDIRKEFLPLEVMWNSSAHISLKMAGITENIEERVKRFNSQNRHSYYLYYFSFRFSYTWFTYKHPLISIYELRSFMSVMTETSSNNVLAVSLH